MQPRKMIADDTMPWIQNFHANRSYIEITEITNRDQFFKKVPILGALFKSCDKKYVWDQIKYRRIVRVFSVLCNWAQARKK